MNYAKQKSDSKTSLKVNVTPVITPLEFLNHGYFIATIWRRPNSKLYGKHNRPKLTSNLKQANLGLFLGYEFIYNDMNKLK